MLVHRQQKLLVVLFIVAGSALAAALVLYAFREGINVFYTPSQVAAGSVPEAQNIRIGGMVKKGSLVKEGLEGTLVKFVATDYNADIAVSYSGVLPDLFREGQGVVAEGFIAANGMFQATRILAKHDENYMSAEVRAALDAAARKQAGPGY